MKLPWNRGGERPQPPHEDAFDGTDDRARLMVEASPPESVTLTFTGPGDADPVAVTVGRDGDEDAFRVTSGGDTSVGALVAALDLAQIDRLCVTLQDVWHGGAPARDEPVGSCLLRIEPKTTRVHTDTAPDQTLDTVSSQRTLEKLREFLASWTEGEHHDVRLHVDGVLETHRVARAADGSVQLVLQSGWTDLSLLLMDLQDDSVIDFFLDEIQAVLRGDAPESGTGGNTTNLTIRPERTQLQQFWATDSVSVDTRELHHELQRLRAFAAKAP